MTGRIELLLGAALALALPGAWACDGARTCPAGELWCGGDCLARCPEGQHLASDCVCRDARDCPAGAELCGGECYEPCPTGSPRQADCLCEGERVWREECGGYEYEACDDGLVRDPESCRCVSDRAPLVQEVYPPDGAVVAHHPAPVISAAFDIEMDSSSFVPGDSVVVTPLPSYETDYDVATRKLVVQSTVGYLPSTSYVVTVRGGEGGVRSGDGVWMEDDHTWQFATEAEGTP